MVQQFSSGSLGSQRPKRAESVDPKHQSERSLQLAGREPRLSHLPRDPAQSRRSRSRPKQRADRPQGTHSTQLRAPRKHSSPNSRRKRKGLLSILGLRSSTDNRSNGKRSKSSPSPRYRQQALDDADRNRSHPRLIRQSTSALVHRPVRDSGHLSRKITPVRSAPLRRSQHQRSLVLPASRRFRKARTARRPQKRSFSLMVYGVRMLILGVGIGAIAGTLLSILDPTSQVFTRANSTEQQEVQETPKPAETAFNLGQEIAPLEAKMQAWQQDFPQLQPGAFIVDLDTGAYLDWEGSTTFSAASTIKVPILIAFFQDVDAGKVRLDELLTLTPEVVAGGSGNLQYEQLGTQYSALEIVTKMMTISDNTATNMIIARLGGAEVLNKRFRSWGLTQTVVRNPLPDLEGTNTTSPRELASLMAMINQGELVSLRSRDRMLNIMGQTVTDTLLPQGLGEGATIAHKTGDIGSILADVGLIDMPTGKRYIAAVMVKRPHNNAKAKELIRQISSDAYQYFNQPPITPNMTSTPGRTPESAASPSDMLRSPNPTRNGFEENR